MPTALIADDEPHLARYLKEQLAALWPELAVVATARNGLEAAAGIEAHQPDIAFLDIRMPGLSGLDAAVELADAWPSDAPFPALVFATAYDQYAVQAFDAQAVDYLLKPIDARRLARTVAKVQDLLAQRQPVPAPAAALAPPALEATMAQLRALLQAPGLGASAAPPPLQPAQPTARLSVIQASHGTQIHMVPVGEVVYFEAADKYVRVLTTEREYLIRTALKELIEQLDPQEFWQVHRSTLVRATAIATVTRDEAGKQHISLRGRPERLPVSRLYAHLFKAM